jgi:hypothetical protein
MIIENKKGGHDMLSYTVFTSIIKMIRKTFKRMFKGSVVVSEIIQV